MRRSIYLISIMILFVVKKGPPFENEMVHLKGLETNKLNN